MGSTKYGESTTEGKEREDCAKDRDVLVCDDVIV